MNDQRKAIFAQRLEIVGSEDLEEIVQDMRHQVIDDLVDEYLPPNLFEQWDTTGLAGKLRSVLALDLPVRPGATKGVDQEVVRERLRGQRQARRRKGRGVRREHDAADRKAVPSQTIDSKWREHRWRWNTCGL